MRRVRVLVLLAVFAACALAGCAAPGNGGESGRREVEFTVVDPEKLPEELLRAIEENREREIRMTYTDGEDMYLVRGYGKQKTGGYSIAVAECTEDDKTILFDTRLLGPKEQEELSKDPSYPWLAVKIEAREKKVVIQ